MKRPEEIATEIAWAAGLFEGEGCFAYTPNHVRAELAMTDHEIVRRFGEVVGVGGFYEKKRYADHHKPQLVWRVTDRAGVQLVLNMFWPWLGVRRRDRGTEILRLQTEASAEALARRAERCRNGHLRTPENTRMQPRPDKPPCRRCLECGREWASRHREEIA